MKKFIKLYLLIVLSVLSMIVLVGCSSGDEGSDSSAEVDIGVVLPTKDEPRWISDESYFQEAAAESEYSVEVLFSQSDPAKEKQNVETLINKGIEVLILCPVDAAASAASADAAKDAGVTVISYDRLISGTDSVDYYVSFDSVAVGAAQAQYLVDNASGEKGQPLYIYTGGSFDNNAFLVFEGSWSVLQPYIADGTFEVVNSPAAVKYKDKPVLTREEMAEIIGETTHEWEIDTGKALAEANLTAASSDQKGDVLILSPNDNVGRAIADTFAADPEITSYVITGQDGEKASIQYIIDGKQSMTVLKDSRLLVEAAMSVAYDVLEGNPPETTQTTNNGVADVPTVLAEIVVVDKTNIQEAVIDTGYYEASDFTGLE